MVRECKCFLWVLFAVIILGARFGIAEGQSCSAFVGVTVVPMDGRQILSNQTVFIRNDRILGVTRADQAKVPDHCTTIDGRHRYLIPGLVDSHVHLPLRGHADQLLVLQLLLANGITTGIIMEGSPEILALRNHRAGKVNPPTIYTTEIFIQQPAFMTAEQVRKEVIAEKAAGYDFIKVHGDRTRPWASTSSCP